MKIKLILILFCLAFSQITYADPASLLIERLDKQQTFTAKFVQTMINANKQIVQSSLGEIDIQRPGKFYWHVIRPTAQTVIADGQKVWIYMPDLQQVIVKSLQQGIGATPALLLTGNTRLLRKTYKVVASNSYHFELTPLEADSMFESISLDFDGNILVEMILHDNLGQTTTVKFHSITINHKIEEERFTFTPPEGVDVIES